jgi:hypothetical protein
LKIKLNDKNQLIISNDKKKEIIVETNKNKINKEEKECEKCGNRKKNVKIRKLKDKFTREICDECYEKNIKLEDRKEFNKNLSLIIIIPILIFFISLNILTFDTEVFFRSLFLFIGVILVLLSYNFFCIKEEFHFEDLKPVSFLITVISVIVVCLLILIPDILLGFDTSTLSSETSKLFYNKFIDIITTLVLGYVFGITLLWNVYKPKLEEIGGKVKFTGKTPRYLRNQSLLFLLLVIYIVSYIYIFLIRELTIIIVNGS